MFLFHSGSSRRASRSGKVPLSSSGSGASGVGGGTSGIAGVGVGAPSSASGAAGGATGLLVVGASAMDGGPSSASGSHAPTTSSSAPAPVGQFRMTTTFFFYVALLCGYVI